MAKPFENHPIYTLITQWHQASAIGDLNTITSLLSEDAVFLVADHPPISRQEFIESFKAIRQSIKLQVLDWYIEELEESGTLAYCRSYLHLAVTPNALGHPIERKGHILSVFRKKPDGNWVLAKDANFLSTVSEE